jgi:O-antigen/teichoic acid export membrane protein
VSAILEAELADARLRIIEMSAQTKLVDQLNHGLELARAAYVARMDGDDLCEPHRLELQRQFLDEHSDVAVVGSHVTIIDARGQVQGRRHYPTQHAAIFAAMQHFNPLAHSSVMFRRQVVVQAGGYRYPERAAQDYELWVRMAVAGVRFANCDEPLLRYRVHASSVKSRRVRDTLQSTVQTKLQHFGRSLSSGARLRLLAERAALLVPPALVLRVFTWLMYSPVSEEARSLRRERWHTILLVVATGCSAVLGMVYMSIAGRRLGPAESADFYGALFFSFVLLTIFSPLGAVVSHFTAVYRARGEPARASALAQWISSRLLWIGVTLVVPLWLTAAPLATVLRLGSQVTLLAAYLIAGSFVWLTLSRSVLRGAQCFGPYAWNLLTESVLRLSFGVLLLQLTASASQALWAYVGSSVVAMVACQLSSVRILGAPEQLGFPRTNVAEIFRYAAPMFVVGMADAGYQNIDILIVKGQFPAHDAGLYGAMASITRILGVLVTPFIVLLLPLISEQHERRLPGGRALLRMCVAFGVIALAPLAAFALWPERIVRAFVGDDFIGAAPLLLPHGASLVVGYMAMLFAQAFAATRRFAFLKLYVAGFLLELLALAFWHATPLQVAMVTLLIKALLLMGLLASWLMAGQATATQAKVAP